MSVLPVGIGSSGLDTGDIGHSLRFRSAASAYLNRTFGVPTSTTIWTWSGWVKRGAITGTCRLFGASTNTFLTFNSSDQLNLTINGVSACTSTAVFRDPTAAIHVVYQQNGASQTIWVNNLSVATGTTAASIFNTAIAHQLGATNTTNFFDGYLSRIAFVDGTALTPSSFGYLNTETNEWTTKSAAAVKSVVDAGGTNSFMLEFDDGTSLTTLGNDYSSKNNDWTLNNFSLTAGTSYDWMLDVPGNSFSTYNAIEFAVNSFSDGNLKCVTSAGGSYTSGTTLFFPTTGKWYAEVTNTTDANSQIGIVAAGYNGLTQLASQPSGYSYYATSGNKFNNGVGAAYGATYTSGDVIGVIFDADSGKLYFSKNGVVQNSGDPVGGTGFAYSGLTGTYCVAVGDGGGSAATLNLNSGQAPLHASATYHTDAGGYFRYAPPSGYKALCQRNLPAPAILNPELHHNAVLDTGANIKTTSEALFPSNFLEWIKDRANANNHQLIDTVRGSSAVLQSNTTAAETTYSAPSGSSVGWVWKAGGAAVSNTAGSITSQVSANVLAGFSVVTYTGTGANATVGHGLGVAPKLVIAKRRNSTGNWPTRHDTLAAANTLYLNTTAASTADATVWNSTAPSSTVFSIGTSADTNTNTGTYVAYCFAEIPGFSKIFSYTGNGSTDGPSVHCGFKPKFVLIKRTDSTGNWPTVDAVRDTENVVDAELFANLSNAEAALTMLDLLSNGFKVRTTNADFNTSGGTYIGIAFADVPGKFSLAR